jgi:hypothetical protein
MRYAKPGRIKPMSEPISAFPPETIGAFLRCCAGEWMSLRSQFSLSGAMDLGSLDLGSLDLGSLDLGSLDLGSLDLASLDQADLKPADPAAPEPASPGEGEAALEETWHSSERGELVVSFLEPEGSASVGGLRVAAGGKGSAQLHFDDQGGFTASGGGGEGQSQGSWQLWPDGSLELRLSAGERLVRERIWFTKANLRLRSTVEQGADGSPARASFCSEIRRVGRPAAAPGPAAAVTPPAN